MTTSVTEQLSHLTEDRMKIGQFYFCDDCKQPIYNPSMGYIVQGNIFAADPSQRLGMIGDNFPKEATFTVDDVRERVYCRRCLMTALNMVDDKSAGNQTNPRFQNRRSSRRNYDYRG